MNKSTDVYYTGVSFSDEDVKGKVAVVIDILRAGSTIITALENGAKGVLPVEDMAEASTIAQNLDPSGYLLCGEKGGKKIEGYHLGNSPFEYQSEKIKKKTLILNTTNGSKALARASVAAEVLVGTFLNASAICAYLKEQDKPIVFICSGFKNRMSFEDLLCAGLFIHKLYDGNLPEDATDGARVAFALYRTYGADIGKAIATSNHAQRLGNIGFDKDIPYCAQLDSTTRVPKLDEGIIS